MMNELTINLEMPIQWENGLGGFGRLKQIFFDFDKKKSVLICRIRPIRFPIVSLFSKAEIADSSFTFI
jgi:hypothetical protein